VLLAVYSGVAYLLFAYSRYWLDLVAPLMAGGFVTLGCMVYNHFVRDVDERLIKKAFERYVAPKMMDRILEKPELIDVSGKRKRLTVLFSDVQGYTALTQALTPVQILDVLREYLEVMVRVIFRYDGTVDKIMGDGIMAFFGDPVPQEDHARRAVLAGLLMQQEVVELQRKWIGEGKVGLQIRIGIATGDVYVGNIGSSQHIEYTVIGKTVNHAARLEPKAPPGGVLISNETYKEIGEKFKCVKMEGLMLKGYRRPVEAYRVLGPQDNSDTIETNVGPRPTRSSERRDSKRVKVVTGIKYSFDGKSYVGRVTDASSDGVFVSAKDLPSVGEYVSLEGEVHADDDVMPVYILGKVQRVVTEGEERGMGIHFEHIRANDKNTIRYFLRNVFGIKALQDADFVVGAQDSGHPTYEYHFTEVLERAKKKTGKDPGPNDMA
jgi:class 3 adenylate cyclase